LLQSVDLFKERWSHLDAHTTELLQINLVRQFYRSRQDPFDISISWPAGDCDTSGWETLDIDIIGENSEVSVDLLKIANVGYSFGQRLLRPFHGLKSAHRGQKSQRAGIPIARHALN
jgi:hypothetical protein